MNYPGCDGGLLLCVKNNELSSYYFVWKYTV